MAPFRFPGHNVMIAANQNPYSPMPAYRFGDEKGTTLIGWKLSRIERLKLLFSGVLWQYVLTFNQPMQPQRLQVEDPGLEAR